MPTSQRQFKPALITQVLDSPYRFEFFQAVRLVEAWLAEVKESDIDLVSKYIRFANSISLHFPTCEIEAIAIEDFNYPECESFDINHFKNSATSVLRVTPTLFGLLGVSGTLPVHYTERIGMHLILEKNDGPRAFFDTFSTRAVTLFFEAWRKYRPEFRRRTLAPHGFLNQLLSIAGSVDQFSSNSIPETHVQPDTLAYFAAAIRHKPVSYTYLNRVLEEYFQIPIKITPFIGAWYSLPIDQQSSLGGTHAALGISTVVGTRVWQRDLRQRIEIGPLDEASFTSFLPSGNSAQALRQLLKAFTGISIEYEVKLVLHSTAVKSAVLVASSGSGMLGRSAFLKTVDDASHRSDVHYDILAF